MSISKLVRDKIPEIMSASDEKTSFRVALDEEEYKEFLNKKFLEETNEFLKSLRDKDSKARQMEELADVKEVAEALCALYGYSLDEIRNIQKIKREQKGGFDKRIILEKQ